MTIPDVGQEAYPPGGAPMQVDPPAALDDVASILAAYTKLDKEIGEWTRMRDALRKRIEGALGDAEVGTVGGRTVVRWSPFRHRRLSTVAVRKRFTDAELDGCYMEITGRRFTLVTEVGTE